MERSVSGQASGAARDILVFVGPTLSRAEAAQTLDAQYLDPVAQGDIYRALAQHPMAAAIAIIDGYFSRVPAVWHKEILWALAQGVPIFGASSMGALRAAELAPFGMVGIGKVYAALVSGELEDDDEVTISHADADAGFRPLSEAMVDLRATYARAVAEQIIDAPLGAALTACAKAMHYARRSHAAVLAEAERTGLSPDRAPLDRLRGWLPAHRVAQKRADALELLQTLRTLRERGPLGPITPAFRFEHTDAWEQVVRRNAHTPTDPASPTTDPRNTAPLLDELRLSAQGRYWFMLEGALLRTLASAEARRHNLTIDEALLGETANHFFLQRGTLSPEAIQAWMADARLDAEGLAYFLQREARLHWAKTLHASEILTHLPDQLRASGDLLPLVERARAKQRLHQQLGEAMLAVDEAEGQALLMWFFTERRGQAPPGDADVCAQVLGFESGQRLLHALALERCFSQR